MIRTMIRFTVEQRTQPSNQPSTVHTEEVKPEQAGKRYIELLSEFPGSKVKQQTVNLGDA